MWPRDWGSRPHSHLRCFLVVFRQFHLNFLSTSAGVIGRDSCCGLCDTLLHFRAQRGVCSISDPFSYSFIPSLIQNISQSCVNAYMQESLTVMDFFSGRKHWVINTSNSGCWEKWESIIISLCVKHSPSTWKVSLSCRLQTLFLWLPNYPKGSQIQASKKKEQQQQKNLHQAHSLSLHANTPWGTI